MFYLGGMFYCELPFVDVFGDSACQVGAIVM